MKDIFTIFVNDLKSAARNVIVFIVIIGICILPALYAWFNIAANWDPYSSTGGIPFAVCSKDKGASFNILLSVNAGDKIIDELKKNDKMGWNFVDENEAVEGVRQGRYFAAVVIPEEFSEDLMSVLSGKFKQAELHYYINEKRNAIAPKITKAGIETVQESINTAYVNTITTMIASTLNLATGSLDGTVDTGVDKVLDALRDVQNSIDGFKTTVDVFISAIDTAESVVTANKENLPNIDSSLAKAGIVTGNVKDSLNSAKALTGNVTDSIEDILSSAEGFSDSVEAKLDEVFGIIESNSSQAADAMVKITEPGEKIITIESRVYNSLKKIEEVFGLDLSKVTGKLDSNMTRWEKINDAILEAARTIRSKGALPNEKKQELYSMLNTADSEIANVKEAFRSVKSTIDRAIDQMFTVVDNASDFLQSLSGDIPDFSATLDNANNTMENMKATLENVKTFMDSSKTNLGNMIDNIEKIKNNDTLMNMINPIIENPQALGDFVSSPVKTVTERIFPVENYGSGMTPFYSSLAIWVGGIILVAVLRTDLLKREQIRLRKTDATKEFFGRYIIFFMLGQIQALITSLGDLFFLKVQCDNPVLFVLGLMFSSFIYTLLIYSLTITFSVIGKALAVIILVIQIAGAGGTFPVEVLPEPFQAVSPFLPFKYGVDLLREAVAGADPSAYVHNLLILLIFVPASLLLGLFLRRPCIRAIKFFNKRIEQSDIVI